MQSVLAHTEKSGVGENYTLSGVSHGVNAEIEVKITESRNDSLTVREEFRYLIMLDLRE